MKLTQMCGIGDGLKSAPGVLRGWGFELEPKARRGNVVRIDGGAISVDDKKGQFLFNFGYDWKYMPKGRSWIVVRYDRQAEHADVQVLPGGWRRWLGRFYNWLCHRYVDIPLAEVTCRDGVVIDIRDTRAFAAAYTKIWRREKRKWLRQ